jgi:hypothetical protein
MSPEAYLLCHDAVEFISPVSWMFGGNSCGHCNVQQFEVFNTICPSILCLHTINDIDFGFSDVESNTMLAQLQTTFRIVYGFGSRAQSCTSVGGMRYEFTDQNPWGMVGFP